METLPAMPDDWSRALAIVAHPDDLEYGAAAAIAGWTRTGRSVTYLLVTRGEAGIDGLPPERSGPLREDEQRRAAAIVGVDVVEFLEHRDGVVELGPALRRDVVEAIRRHRPELVVTINHHDTWAVGRWNSSDHRAVGRAVLDGTQEAGNRWIFPDAGVAWSGVRWVAVSGSPNATHAVDVAEDLDRAVASLEAHREYLRALGDAPMADPRAFLTAVAEAQAPRFHGRPAATFELFEM